MVPSHDPHPLYRNGVPVVLSKGVKLRDKTRGCGSSTLRTKSLTRNNSMVMKTPSTILGVPVGPDNCRGYMSHSHKSLSIKRAINIVVKPVKVSGHRSDYYAHQDRL